MRRCRRSRPREPRRRHRSRAALRDRSADRHRPSTASPRPGRRRGSRHRGPRACSSAVTERPSSNPFARASSAPASPWPRCTPSAPSASAASTSSLTTNVTPRLEKPRPRSTIASVGAFTRSWTTVAPASTAACAAGSESTIACTLTRRAPARPASPGRARRARRRARRGTSRGLSRPSRRPRPRRRRRRAPRRPLRADGRG